MSAPTENHQFDAKRLGSARMAVSAAFFANGMMIGHWAPKIPIMVDRLDISERVLGQMIILLGVGALIALIAGAWLVTRLGSPNVVRWSSIMLAPALVFITITPDALTTALAMLWLGVFLGGMDNAMNANGVGVEMALEKPVMSSYHGFWSLGVVFGGLTGGAIIAIAGEMGHALIVMVLAVCLSLWAWPRYLPDAPSFTQVDGADENQPKKVVLPKSIGIYILGVATLLGFAPEGTVIDWSALYLKDELGAPVIVSGYAVAAFSATMALMRFRGDGLRARFGDRMTFIGSGVISALGLLIAGLAQSVFVACFGFLIAGLGMANVVPVLFSAAGRYPGIAPAVGIAIVTAFGYGGLLFIPAFVGLVAEAYSIGLVFTAWAAIVVMVALSGPFLPGIDRVEAAEPAAEPEAAAIGRGVPD
ncbi:MAG: MFS transporter [Pseudomonadota bacterium]